jgi:excisionase family DNA binding protein
MFAPRLTEFLDKKPTESTGLLTIAEAAKLLSISIPGLRRLQQDRRIPFFKVGRCVRFAKDDLAAYLSKRRIEAIG